MSQANHPPLVMLPGMMCDERLFAPQVALFSKTRKVQVADLSRGDSIAAMAMDVLAQAPSYFALMGLSMGGIVAMEILRIAPQRLAGVALLDTNAKAELPQRKALRDVQINTVRKGGLAQVIGEEMKPMYLAKNLTSGALKSSPDTTTVAPCQTNKAAAKNILDLCMAMAEDLGDAVFIRQSQALKYRKDQQATLAKVNVPTLILMGQEDTLCPLSNHQLMAQLIPQAQFVTIANAGHLPTLEQPQLTNVALTTWLNQL